MRETSSAGAVFIKEGIILPQSLPIKSEPYSKGWRLTTEVAGCDLDRKVSEAGWTLFFMAGEITATVFGSHSERSTHKAVTKLLSKSDGFNCLEVSQVAGARFLGLPCVTASGHARHVQQSMCLIAPRQAAK